MSMFEQAVRSKLRVETSKGICTVEDLWDLRLEGPVSLNSIAKGLNKKIKESEEESFVVKKSSADEALTLSFDIVKYIIGVKLKEQEDAAASGKIKKDNEEILSLISIKEKEGLLGKSVEELKALIK